MIFFDKAVWKKVGEDNHSVIADTLYFMFLGMLVAGWVVPIIVLNIYYPKLTSTYLMCGVWVVFFPVVSWIVMAYTTASSDLTEEARKAISE